MSLPAPSLPNPVEDFGELLIEPIEPTVREVLPYADGPRLLVVEDEPVDRTNIRRLLRKTGISTTVDEAESVTSAQIDHARVRHPIRAGRPHLPTAPPGRPCRMEPQPLSREEADEERGNAKRGIMLP